MSRRRARRAAAAAAAAATTATIPTPQAAPSLPPSTTPPAPTPASNDAATTPISSTTPLTTALPGVEPSLLSYYESLREGLLEQIVLGTQTQASAVAEFHQVIGATLLDNAITTNAVQSTSLATQLLTVLVQDSKDSKDSKDSSTTVGEHKQHNNTYDHTASHDVSNRLTNMLLHGSTAVWNQPEYMNQFVENAKSTKQLVKEEKLLAKRQKAAQKRHDAAENRLKQKHNALSLHSGFDACAVTTSTGDHAQTGSSSSEVALKIEGLDMAFDGGSGHLLRHSSLMLVRGRRYGLTGRNGVGKSTLLHHLAKLAPDDLSVLHVAQEVAGDETSALQSVLNADEHMTDLLALEQALLDDDSSTPEELKKGKGS